MNDATAPTDAQQAYRSLGVALAAGIIAGLLVVGVAGRIVMRISAIAADSDGLLTEGGNRVGDITVGGTIGLIVFGGILFGVAGGFVFLTMRPWLPQRTGLRTLALTAAFPMVGTATIVAPESSDFLLLDPPELNVAMFAGLIALFGTALVGAETLVEHHLPHARATPAPDGAEVAIAAAVLAVPVAIATLLFLADDETALVGLFVLLMGIATIVRTVGPLEARLSPRLRSAVSPLGYSALIAACIAGTLSAANEISKIV